MNTLSIKQRILITFATLGAMLVVAATVLFFHGLTHLAGGIDMQVVMSEFARYEGYDLARRIIQRDADIPTNVLVKMSRNDISGEAMTVLLLHPSFPQNRRNELILQGKSGFYRINAIPDKMTKDDVVSFINSGFFFESELDSLLDCSICDEELKSQILARKEKMLSFRLRGMINNLLGRNPECQ